MFLHSYKIITRIPLKSVNLKHIYTMTKLSICYNKNIILDKGQNWTKITNNNYIIEKKVFFHDIKYEDLQNVSLNEMKTLLKNNQIDFEEGYTCLLTKCPFCQDFKKTKSLNNLFINKHTGHFLCGSCQIWGQWQQLSNIITGITKDSDIASLKQKIITEINQISKQWIKITKSSIPLTSLKEEEIFTILRGFNLPEVKKINLELYTMYINTEKDKLYFPLKSINGNVCGYKVIQINLLEEDTFPRKKCFGLIAIKHGRANKNDAIIVSKISDALALSTSKINCNIICLPYGLSSLPIEILPYLERFNKLTLWFENNTREWEVSKHFAKKLNEKRCNFLRPFLSNPSPLVAYKSQQDLKELYSNSHPIWHKSIITFENLREEVLLEFQNIDKVQGIKWKRFPPLNKFLRGHRRGELTVLTGPTGSGKTTFVSEYSLDLAMQGVNTLWGSFEIRNARLAKTMLKQMAEIDFENHIDQFDYWADQFEKLPIYYLTFHGQQSIKTVMDTLEHAIYIHDITHTIIDNLQFMMGISSEIKADRFWKQDLIISNFRNFATKKNCHVTLIIHPRKERQEDDLTINSIFGSAKAVQESDNVLIIQDKRLLSVKGRKYLQVAKNRYSGDLGIMPLNYNKESSSFAIKKKSENTQESKALSKEDIH